MTHCTDQILPADASVPTPPGTPHPRALLFTIDVEASSLSSTVPHVSNITYVAWIDRVAELAGEHVGHTRKRLFELNRMWFVARHEIDYLAEAFAGERIVAATWIHDARRSSVRRDTLLWRAADEVEVARARSTWSYIDLERRRPCRMPEEVTSLLDPLMPPRQLGPAR